MLDIVDEEVDVAGRHRVRVNIDGSTVMFKYDEEPTVERLEEDVARYIYNRDNPPPDPESPVDGAA